MTTLTCIVELVLMGFFYAHMRIVATDTSEIDIRIVFGKIPFVAPFKASAHLESLCMAGHNKGVVSSLARHVNCKNGVEVHARSKIGKFFPGF